MLESFQNPVNEEEAGAMTTLDWWPCLTVPHTGPMGGLTAEGYGSLRNYKYIFNREFR